MALAKDDDEYAELQAQLNKNPEAGVVVPGSGGVRKLRWAAEGRGKRGGLRIIYFVRLARGHLDAYCLWQERHGEHPGTYSPSDEKGS